MPESAHASGFLASEWDRFTRGWAALDPIAQSEAEARAFGRQGTAGGQGSINVPGWGDVIHFTPAYQPTKAEADEFFGARRQNRDPNISRDAFDSLTSREAAKDRMASSAQPGYAQAVGQMMTAVDNVQDALATAATVGRLVVNPALGALGHFAPGLAGKIGARLIPGIGWILGAADLLNLLSWLGLGGLIGYGALCQGFRGAYAPAVAQAGLRGLAGLRPCGGKAKVGQLADLNPFASAGRLKNARRAARSLPGIGNLLEAAQTTDQLFGVGVSLGGLVGTVMEGAYAATGAGRGQGTRVNPSALDPRSTYRGPAGGTLAYADAVGLLARFAPGTLARVRETSDVGLRRKWQLARVLADAPMLLADQGALSERDYSGALVALCFAVELFGEELAGADVDAMLLELAALEVGPVAVVPPYLGALLGASADQGASVGAWALPGAPRAVSGAALAGAYAPALADAMRAWLLPRREDVAGMFLGACYVHANARVWSMLTGEREPFAWRFTPDFVILQSLMESSYYPADSAPESVLWGWWSELRSTVEETEARSLSPRELLGSAARHGVPIIYAEQPYLRASAPDIQAT
jgi:hypothetical protein